MAGGYSRRSSDEVQAFADEIKSIWTALRDLARPTGTSIASLVAQVQAALANINASVTAAIEANSYTAAEIDSKIANPVNVSASGQVSSNGAPLKSLPSHDYIVSSGYVAGWINGDGTIGTSPSGGAVKVDLKAMDAVDAAKVLELTPYWGRYAWDDPDSPLKAFVLAEDVQAAGFGPDVAPVVTGDPVNISADPENPVMVEPGKAWTVNYSQLVVPLLAALRTQQDEINDLKSRLTTAGIA